MLVRLRAQGARRLLLPTGMLVPAVAVLLALAPAGWAARTVYFTDPGAEAIAPYSVGPGGALAPLGSGRVPAEEPHRLAMTSTGRDLYATAEDGVLQYDVAADGRLTPKPVPSVHAG